MIKGIRRQFISYVFLFIVGVIMIFPLIWMFFASFKPNNEIFGNVNIFPSSINLNSYVSGWKGHGQMNFGVFLLNSLELVVPTVIFTVLSSVLVAYGFARFRFPFKKLMFSIMISTLILPNAVLVIPRYLLFRNLNWLDTYKTFTMPALFACTPFFIYMLIQFFRSIPFELDESAKIDGCDSFFILVRIMIPLCKPAIISAALFQAVWTWEDFFNSLIYITTVKKFTVSLALRMAMDTSEAANWSGILAMAVVSMLPCVLLFIVAQKYFVEGISTSGLKG
jgi:oligogalacturonide transport system permease protein